jgi:FtsZ-binding cell division protein ZapB
MPDLDEDMGARVKGIEKHAGVLVAVLAVVTAALGALSGYLKVKADTAVDTRHEVQVRATDLQSDKSSLQKQIAALREENDNLNAQLKTEPAPTASDRPTAVTRDLKVPISDNGGNEYIMLDDGAVTQCCSGDFIYARQESTGEPELRAYSGGTPYSIDVSSAGVTPEECSDAVTRSPAAAPVRNLHAGTLICINTNGGTSLLRVVAAPARDGSLRLRQRFWPKES